MYEHNSFLWLNIVPLYGYTTFCLIHSSVDILLSCSYLLAVMHNAHMDICIHVFAWPFNFQMEKSSWVICLIPSAVPSVFLGLEEVVVPSA